MSTQRLSNQEIAYVLYQIGEFLEIQEVAFKPRAYERAGRVVEAMDRPVREGYTKGGLKALENIPGVGLSIAAKIEELIKTGRLKYYEEIKKQMPVDVEGLSAIEGVGPKHIKEFWQKLKIKTAEDLEKAAKNGKLRKLPRMSEKLEQKIITSLEFHKAHGMRFFIGEALPLMRDIEKRLQNLKWVRHVAVAGSIRRRKETIGDGDILATSDNPQKVMDYFVSMPEVAEVLAHGETKSMVRLHNGLEFDLRVVPQESLGAALQYFTGNKDHNVALRKIAIAHDWKLNEYGLFKIAKQRKNGRETTQKEVLISGRTEEEVYAKLGLAYIEPELREMTGELKAAEANTLPKLVGYGDLQGDLQVQTNWTDGANSLEEMAEAAKRVGLKYIAITDHTKRLAMTGGLDEKRLLQQMAEIDTLNKKISGIAILKGSEVDILKDGSLDISDTVLAKLDIVGASVHSYFDMSRKEMTARVVRAMQNSHVDILFHPTGRVVNSRPPYEIDMEAIIKTAKKTGTVLEANASKRLDLKDEYIRMAVGAGVKIAIDSDAHAAPHFSFLEYGIAQARRGWAEKKDIINGWPMEKMLSMLKTK